MNRRGLFKGLAAGLAASMLPAVPLLAASESDRSAIIKDFVEQKRKDYPDFFLFKNRSGQFVFSVYDSETGNPTANEMVYLCYGKPLDLGPRRGWVLPINEGSYAFGIPVIPVSVSMPRSDKAIRAALETAFVRVMGQGKFVMGIRDQGWYVRQDRKEYVTFTDIDGIGALISG